MCLIKKGRSFVAENSKCKNEHEDIRNVKIIIIIQLILIEKHQNQHKILYIDINIPKNIVSPTNFSWNELHRFQRRFAIKSNIRSELLFYLKALDLSWTETESTVLFVCSPTNANEVSQRTSTRLHNGDVYKVKRSLITRRDDPCWPSFHQ